MSRFSRKLLFLLFGLLLIIFGFGLGRPSLPTEIPIQLLNTPQPSPISSPKISGLVSKVIRVIDGDTIEIEGNQKIRYIGIDTPETVDPRKPVQCFGKEAAAENRKLVEGKEVRMEKDVSETDKYGRLLHYVFVDNLFVNDYLVRNGFAHALTYPPDIKYQDQFRQAEQEARENQRGLWDPGACQEITTPVSSQNGDCLIKGNISSTGEKIYHLPGQRYYDKTVIDESKGERWFCSEGEALSAGWRKSKI